MSGSESAFNSRISAALGDQLAGLWSGLADQPEPLAPRAVVELAAQAMPMSVATSLTLLRKDQRGLTLAASDPLAEHVSDLQSELGEGPCLHAATGPAVVTVDDLTTDDRWPAFAAACVQRTGIRSMLCLRLPIGRQDEAALNFHSRSPAAFTPDDVVTGSVIVPFSAMAVEAHLRQEEIHHLETALQTARSIGTAIGIVMAHRKVSREEAFQILRKSSMDLNVKLRDVADQVERMGTLPEPAGPRNRDANAARYRPFGHER